MKLYLIRHGQSANNSLPVEQRVHDPHLTELGRRQVLQLGTWGKSAELSRLITSPFRRALQTTRALVETTGLIPEVRTPLHERGGCYTGCDESNFSGMPGMNRSEIQAEFPDYTISNEIDEDGWWKFGHRETNEEAQHRGGLLIEQTIEEFGASDEVIAYVMHADFISILVNLVSTRSQAEIDRSGLEETQKPESSPHLIWNAGVTQLDVKSDSIRVSNLNSADHLADEIRSR